MELGAIHGAHRSIMGQTNKGLYVPQREAFDEGHSYGTDRICQ